MNSEFHLANFIKIKTGNASTIYLVIVGSEPHLIPIFDFSLFKTFNSEFVGCDKHKKDYSYIEPHLFLKRKEEK